MRTARRTSRRGPSSSRTRLPFAGGALLAALGALLASCGSQSAALADHPAFDERRAWTNLERIVALGPRPAGSEAIEELRKLLAAELQSYGLEPRREDFTQVTPIGSIEFANVWVDLRGARRAGEPAPPLVLIATHFDTKRLPGFVGANDGGSGTAILLELARVLAPSAGERAVDYRLLFLDGEEATLAEWEGDDNTYGSRHHVETLRASGDILRTGAFVLLDLLGDADLGIFRESYSDTALVEIFFRAARQVGAEDALDGRRLEIKDDHLSFLNAGVPSVDLIDFDYGPDNSYWHTEHDTLEHVSAASLRAAGRIARAR
jgi:hypothetical protein